MKRWQWRWRNFRFRETFAMIGVALFLCALAILFFALLAGTL
jgi:hypothetical protein